MNASQLKHELKNFTGTSHYYKLTPFNAVATDGVYFLMTNATAHWLITECLCIVTSLEKQHPHEYAYFFELQKTDSKSATLTCEDGGKGENNGEAIVYAQKIIPYTDFPLEAIQIWFMRDPMFHWVGLLPSEY